MKKKYYRIVVRDERGQEEGILMAVVAILENYFGARFNYLEQKILEECNKSKEWENMWNALGVLSNMKVPLQFKSAPLKSKCFYNENYYLRNKQLFADINRFFEIIDIQREMWLYTFEIDETEMEYSDEYQIVISIDKYNELKKISKEKRI